MGPLTAPALRNRAAIASGSNSPRDGRSQRHLPPRQVGGVGRNRRRHPPRSRPAAPSPRQSPPRRTSRSTSAHRRRRPGPRPPPASRLRNPRRAQRRHRRNVRRCRSARSARRSGRSHRPAQYRCPRHRTDGRATQAASSCVVSFATPVYRVCPTRPRLLRSTPCPVPPVV